MKVLVTGANGLAGYAIQKLSHLYDYDFVFVGRNFGDLCDESNVVTMFDVVKPDYVIHTAAAVGGIGGNAKNHGKYFRDNLLMGVHLIHHAMLNDVKKFVAFSSVCVYPDGQILREDNIHSGPVYSSNFAYGYAKRMTDIQIQAYQAQYGIKNYCSVTLSNIFGPNDQFNIECGHVVPVLMHKLFLAKQNNTSFNVWGDGSSLREFMYVDDIAKAAIDLLGLDELPSRIIVTGEKETSIKELIDILVDIAEFDGEVVWETDKPNGQKMRPSDKTLLRKTFPDFKYTPLKEGLKLTWDWLNKNYPNIRQ